MFMALGVPLACSPMPRGPSDPIDAGADDKEPSALVIPLEVQEESPSEDARILEEVSAMDRAAQWAWAVSKMPALATHGEVDKSDELWAEFRRHAAKHSTLWVRLPDRGCNLVRGTWDDEYFSGRAHVVAKISGNTKTVRFESVTIDRDGIVFSGPHGEELTRDLRTGWRVTGGYGVGSARSHVLDGISEVRGKTAYYGAYAYSLTIECVQQIVYDELCIDGTKRHCERCGSLWARPHASNRSWGRGSPGAWGSSARPHDCSEPCPPDTNTANLPALEHVMRGRRFFASDGPVAAVHTSKRACENDPKIAPD
jgi:hypothetical protein